jgi:DNA-binding transcriptional regulator YiaG
VGIDDVLAAATARRNLPPAAVRRELREAAGVSQGAVADELGVDRATVCRWELGKRVPRGAHAIAYRELLDRLAREVLH